MRPEELTHRCYSGRLGGKGLLILLWHMIVGQSPEFVAMSNSLCSCMTCRISQSPLSSVSRRDGVLFDPVHHLHYLLLHLSLYPALPGSQSSSSLHPHRMADAASAIVAQQWKGLSILIKKKLYRRMMILHLQGLQAPMQTPCTCWYAVRM